MVGANRMRWRFASIVKVGTNLIKLFSKAKNLYGWSQPSQMEVIKTSPEEGKSEAYSS